MKTSLWVVVVVVTGVVGFLIGYSVSPSSGATIAAAHARKANEQSVGAEPAKKSGGYGAQLGSPSAGGYGAEQPPAKQPPATQPASTGGYR